MNSQKLDKAIIYVIQIANRFNPVNTNSIEINTNVIPLTLDYGLSE